MQNSLDIAASQSGTVVAYFYFDFNDVKKQKSHIALRSLLFQLALVLPDCLKALDEAYRRCSDGKQQPSDDTVRSLLLSALTLSNQKYLIIDALDECTDRQILLTFLQSVATSPQHKVGMLVTSRREKDIEDELRPVAQHIMNIQSAQVDNDISVYVRDRLTTDLKLRKWPQAVKDEIAEELMSKANGMYVALLKPKFEEALLNNMIQVSVDLLPARFTSPLSQAQCFEEDIVFTTKDTG